jgi:hypothetical protein
MTGARALAIFAAACALAGSALIALPIDGAEAPPPAINAAVSDTDDVIVHRPALAGIDTSEEAHAGVPRLWLGSPVAR